MKFGWISYTATFIKLRIFCSSCLNVANRPQKGRYLGSLCWSYIMSQNLVIVSSGNVCRYTQHQIVVDLGPVRRVERAWQSRSGGELLHAITWSILLILASELWVPLTFRVWSYYYHETSDDLFYSIITFPYIKYFVHSFTVDVAFTLS